MTTFGDVESVIFTTFCNTLGCGGEAGFIVLGLVVVIVFIMIAMLYKFGFDAMLSIFPVLLIILADNGYLFPEFRTYVLIVIAVIWAPILWRFFKG